MPPTEPPAATGNDLPAKDAQENGEKSPVSSGPAEDADALKLLEDAEKKQQKKAKLGLLLLLLKQSIKAALPPTVALAILQSNTVAVYFGNVGYIAAIATVFGVAMLPRARFLQTAAANCLAICLACAVNMLAMYTAIAARTNTTPPSTAPPQPGLPPYNSSQSAVSAIWLFAQVWAVNGVRVHWPSLNLPTVVYTIITSTSLSSSVRFTSVTQAENFSRELLVAFLGAQAIVIAISLLVFPLSCRTMALGKSMQLMGTLKGVMKAQVAYLEAIAGSSEEEEGGLEGDQATAGAQKTAAWTPWWKRRKARKAAAEDEDDTAGMAGPEAKVLKEAVHGAIQLFGALAADMEAAQTEFFWGKLSADDLGVLLNRLRDCLIPISGVQSLADISLRVYEAEAQDKEGGGEETLLESWKTIVAELQSPFTELTKLVADGFDHTTIVLGMTPPRPSVAKGDESSSEAPTDRPAVPGVPGFSAAFEARLQAVHEETRGILRSRSDAVKPVSEADPDDYDNLTRRRREPEAQAYLLLHTDTLMQAAGQAVLALMQFADAKVADGTMARNRLAVPNWLRLRKFFANVLSSDDVQADQGQDTITNSPTVSGISLVGDSFAKHRDPDHLPPANAFQSFGAAVSRGWGVVGSLDSVQGLRCAAAVMSVAIISFLEPTQEFFLRHRLVWAETIIILGMATSPGANVWGLVTRVVGTAVGVVLSLASWYIPDQHPAGVIVIQWLGMVLMYAVMMAFPKLLQGVFVGVVTTVMITGYELQVGVLGPAFVATALQEYQPIYELAPYRLATVAVGCFVAFVWSVFPYPVTERQIVRLELARGLHLLTESFGIAHSGLLWRTRLAQEGIDAGPDEEGRRKLQEMRRLLFRKMAVLLPDVRQHVAWQKWEPILGGSWPADTYNRIILRATRIFQYLTLASYVSLHAPEPSEAERARWQQTAALLRLQLDRTMHSVMSALVLASSSLHSGRSLPPYIPLPEYRELRGVLRVLSEAVGKTEEGEAPAYATFAVREVSMHFVCDDLRSIVEDVGKLVGTVDFSLAFGADVEAGILATGGKS